MSRAKYEGVSDMSDLSTTTARPAIGDRPGYVTDGGMETDLIFHRGVELPEFAAFPLLEEVTGRALLRAYYDDYAQVAAQVGAGLILESPTWRANPDWGVRLGYGPAQLAVIDREAVRFLQELAAGYAQEVSDVLVCGMVGPRGDGYVVGRVMSSDEAADYHRSQIDSFAQSGVDIVTAYTLTTAAEAIGIVEAARAARVAVAISFTVEVDGLLPDGSCLGAALATVDGVAPPDYFLVNCTHPHHIAAGIGALVDAGGSTSRIHGVRYNASRLSHADLDAAEELDEGDPIALCQAHTSLCGVLPSLRIVGGCCGTDARHVAQLWGADSTGLHAA